MRIAVIGAGPSGITAVKNLVDKGFTDITVFDRGTRVGGNWVFDAESGHSSVFETTHIISSKRYSQYDDMPMPDHYPDYPSHTLLADYFQNYASKFGLEDFICFRTMVQHCEPIAGDRWRLDLCDETNGKTRSETFDYLVVCNGHHWHPRYPDYPGTFTGEWLHSHDFKRAEGFRDKQVLVIGGGNSACDVAVETSRVSRCTDISMRRGYWILPKFLFGEPTDHVHARAHKYFSWLPRSISTWLFEMMIRLEHGDQTAYGLQKPDHHVLQTHPTMNSELVYFLRHGEVGAKGDIARFEGKTVYFTDGTSRDYDAVVCCTGYRISHPFFDRELIDYSIGKPRLFLKMLPADVKNVAFLGLFQPLGCVWPAAELQAKILARMLSGEWAPPVDLESAIGEELDRPDVVQLDTPRHTITVDYPSFRDRLLKELPPDYVSREPVHRTAHAEAAE